MFGKNSHTFNQGNLFSENIRVYYCSQPLHLFIKSRNDMFGYYIVCPKTDALNINRKFMLMKVVSATSFYSQ